MTVYVIFALAAAHKLVDLSLPSSSGITFGRNVQAWEQSQGII